MNKFEKFLKIKQKNDQSKGIIQKSVEYMSKRERQRFENLEEERIKRWAEA